MNEADAHKDFSTGVVLEPQVHSKKDIEAGVFNQDDRDSGGSNVSMGCDLLHTLPTDALHTLPTECGDRLRVSAKSEAIPASPALVGADNSAHLNMSEHVRLNTELGTLSDSSMDGSTQFVATHTYEGENMTISNLNTSDLMETFEADDYDSSASASLASPISPSSSPGRASLALHPASRMGEGSVRHAIRSRAGSRADRSVSPMPITPPITPPMRAAVVKGEISPKVATDDDDDEALFGNESTAHNTPMKRKRVDSALSSPELSDPSASSDGEDGSAPVGRTLDHAPFVGAPNPGPNGSELQAAGDPVRKPYISKYTVYYYTPADREEQRRCDAIVHRIRKEQVKREGYANGRAKVLNFLERGRHYYQQYWGIPKTAHGERSADKEEPSSIVRSPIMRPGSILKYRGDHAMTSTNAGGRLN